MRKKVDISDLKPGMYVSDLDRPWTETPFIFQGFTIDSYTQIEELRTYCNYVFVEEAVPIHGTPERQIEIDLFKKTARGALHARIETEPAASVPFADELRQVQVHYVEFAKVAESFMKDARLGHSLDITPVKETVRQAVESVLRNPDALLCLTQLKDKSQDVALHSLRVAILAIAFGRHLKLALPALNALGIGALLHDVGKAKLPEPLLHKVTPLTASEHELMKTHVPLGTKILSQTRDVPRDAIEAVALHHEHYDGTGYPGGIKKSSSTIGRITALVNHYDNLTSEAPRRRAVSPHAALLRLYGLADALFDRTMVERFTQCVGIYPVGSMVELNTGHVGMVTAVNRMRYLRPKVALVLDDQGRRYHPIRMIDLACEPRDEASRPWEIKTVLTPEALTLIPADALAALAGGATR